MSLDAPPLCRDCYWNVRMAVAISRCRRGVTGVYSDDDLKRITDERTDYGPPGRNQEKRKCGPSARYFSNKR